MAEQVEDEIEDKEKKPPAGANQQLEEAQKRIKELEDRTTSLESEKKGIYSDYKKERENRQKLEQSLEEKERRMNRETGEDDLGELGDEEFITGKHLKKLLAGLNARDKKRAIENMESRANERVATDEERMEGLCASNPEKYHVPYEEAIDAFKELAEKDPTLWQEYDRARFRPGGKPAELAYKIALREHPKYKERSEKTVREKLIDELNEKEKRPAKLKPGGSGGKRLEDMSDDEIANMTDDELERHSR